MQVNAFISCSTSPALQPRVNRSSMAPVLRTLLFLLGTVPQEEMYDDFRSLAYRQVSQSDSICEMQVMSKCHPTSFSVLVHGGSVGTSLDQNPASTNPCPAHMSRCLLQSTSCPQHFNPTLIVLCSHCGNRVLTRLFHSLVGRSIPKKSQQQKPVRTRSGTK